MVKVDISPPVVRRVTIEIDDVQAAMLAGLVGQTQGMVFDALFVELSKVVQPCKGIWVPSTSNPRGIVYNG